MTSPHRTQHHDMERPLGFFRGIYNAVKIEVATIAAFVGIAVVAHVLMGCVFASDVNQCDVACAPNGGATIYWWSGDCACQNGASFDDPPAADAQP